MKTVRWTTPVGVLALLLVAGCGDRGPGVEVLRDFETGAPRDEVVAALPEGPLSTSPHPGWSAVKGYRSDAFLVDGRSWEVLYFTDGGFTPADSLDGSRQTPVVFENDALHGWGWTHLVRLNRELGLPAPPAAPGITAESGETEEVRTGNAFWEQLARYCGNAYPGRLGLEPEGDPMLEGDELLIAHFRSCSPGEILIPFHIEQEGGASWDRSRTWVFRNHGEGRLELRHDHRRPDGTEDEVTWYGAFREGVGTPHRQEFLYDPAEYPNRAGRGWRIELVPNQRYSYGTIRDGEWTWRVDFDLSRPMDEVPPAPWGHEGS